MKRPLFWIGIVFLSATAVFLFYSNVWTAAFILCAVCAALLILFGKFGGMAALFAVLLAAGSFFINQSLHKWRTAPFDSEVIGTMVISEISDYGSRSVLSGKARLRAESIERTLTVSLTVWGGAELSAGDILSFEADVYHPKNDKQRTYDTLMLTMTGECDNAPDAPKLPYLFTTARVKVCSILRDMVSAPYDGVLCAILAGERTFLSEDISDSFRSAGLSHLLVVSGMHLCVVSSLVSRMLVKTDEKKRFILITAGVWAFAAFTGFGVSVVRAALMVTIGESAPLFLRQRDTLSSLAAAGIIITLISPSAVGKLSFLLSFGAVFGIALFASPIENYLCSHTKRKNKFTNVLTTSVSVSLAAQLGTLPINALFFGTVPVIGILTNIPAIPLITPILTLGAIGVVLFPLRALFGLLCKVLIAVLCFTAEFFGSLPLAKVGVGERYVFVFVIFFYIAAVACAFVRPKKDIIRRGLLFSSAVFLFCSCIHLVFSADKATITCFDEPETLVIAKGSSAVIIGAPKNSYEADKIASYLERNNITCIDAVCVTEDTIPSAVYTLSERVKTYGVIAPDSALNRAFCHSAALALYRSDASIMLFGNMPLDISDGVVTVCTDCEGKEIYPREGLCVIIKKYSNLMPLENDILWQIRTPAGGSHDF